MKTLSFWDRVLLAFADLSTYGLAVRTGVTVSVAEARHLIVGEITSEYPDAIGSYVFSTAIDECRLDAAGDLPSGVSLPIYHSGADVTELIAAVCERLGLETEERFGVSESEVRQRSHG